MRIGRLKLGEGRGVACTVSLIHYAALAMKGIEYEYSPVNLLQDQQVSKSGREDLSAEKVV